MTKQIFELGVLIEGLETASKLLQAVGFQPVVKGVGFDAERAVGLVGMNSQQASDYAKSMKSGQFWLNGRHAHVRKHMINEGYGRTQIALSSMRHYLQEPDLEMCHTPQELAAVIKRLQDHQRSSHN